MATHDSGFYIPNMNAGTPIVGNLWVWKNALRGGWNVWGYLNTLNPTRAWVWNNDEPDANCN